MSIGKIQVKIELTKKCNLYCIHCSSKAGPTLATEIAPSLIDRILLDSPAIDRVVLTGGEPFSCSHFWETLEKINLAGFLPSIYTSGIFGNTINIELIKGKISQLIISLHGPENIHDRITNIRGSFKQTTSFLETAVNNQIPTGIHVIALRENIEVIPDLVYKLKNKGLNDISILRYVPQGRGSYNQINPPTKAMLLSLYQKLSGMGVRFGAPFNFIHNKNIPCKVGYKTAMIDVFGNVLPCDSFKEFAAGPERNLSKYTLLEIMSESKLFQLARNNSMSNCKDECCLGQFLLEAEKINSKPITYSNNDFMQACSYA